MSEIRWNPQRQLWETEQADLFSERLEPFLETWPISGMTRSGQLLPLEMSVPPIAGNGSSSLELLHTPDTMPDAPNTGSNTKSKPAGLGNQVIEIALLPTPTTLDKVEKRTTHAAGNLTLQGALCGVNPVDVERQRRAGRSVPSAVMNLDG
jgi:hypothetical protein